jgi:cytochrome c5
MNCSRLSIADSRKKAAWFMAGALTIAVLTGCGNTGTATALPDPPRFDDPHLEAGRATWMLTCRACHLTGVAGAPAVSDIDAWAPRLLAGRSALHASAVNGIRANDGWSMPPRGGNKRLSDSQVRAAVDYMLAAVTDGKADVPVPD